MFANRIVSKLLPGADFSSNPMVVSELAVAALVPIAFLTVNVVVALAEHIVVAISQFAGNFYLIGLSEGFAMGTIFAQLVILAIWAGLSPTNTYLRAGYGLLMLVLGAQLVAMFTARFAPSVAALRNEWLTERGQFGWLLLVVVYSTVQLSLFAYRVWGGRYLAFQTLDSKAMKRQFSMLELVGLPVLVSFPLLVLPVFFEANIGLLIIAITFVSLFICLGYAALFLFGFLRERISIGIVTSLFVCWGLCCWHLCRFTSLEAQQDRIKASRFSDRSAQRMSVHSPLEFRQRFSQDELVIVCDNSKVGKVIKYKSRSLVRTHGKTSDRRVLHMRVLWQTAQDG